MIRLLVCDRCSPDFYTWAVQAKTFWAAIDPRSARDGHYPPREEVPAPDPALIRHTPHELLGARVDGVNVLDMWRCLECAMTRICGNAGLLPDRANPESAVFFTGVGQ